MAMADIVADTSQGQCPNRGTHPIQAYREAWPSCRWLSPHPADCQHLLMTGYDIIGDVHGSATHLSDLLEALGYRDVRVVGPVTNMSVVDPTRAPVVHIEPPAYRQDRYRGCSCALERQRS